MTRTAKSITRSIGNLTQGGATLNLSGKQRCRSNITNEARLHGDRPNSRRVSNNVDLTVSTVLALQIWSSENQPPNPVFAATSTCSIVASNRGLSLH